jgi:uncharacterized membrane protein affecting hemolysin expression
MSDTDIIIVLLGSVVLALLWLHARHTRQGQSMWREYEALKRKNNNNKRYGTESIMR